MITIYKNYLFKNNKKDQQIGMNSPLKKPKQSSLSQFYKKLEYHQQNISNISSTPKKSKSNIQHDINNNKFAGKIQPNEQFSRFSHPLIGQQQYSKLDINSNMKIKLEDILNNNSPSQIKNKQTVYNQNLFKKDQYLRVDQYGYEPQSSQLMTKKFDHQDSELDYNLSVQPQQIKIPQVQRYQNKVNQFKMYEDQHSLSNLQGNFLITPETSLIKSPEKVQPGQIKNFTPEQTKNMNVQPPTSQIIQRLSFNSVSNSKQQDKLFNRPQTKPFQKQKQHSVSPSSNLTEKNIKRHSNSPHRTLKHVLEKHQHPNVPSPTRKSDKSNQLQIKKQSPKKSEFNNQILSSDDEDSSQLFSKLKQLQSQVQTLKSHKYQFTISKYRQQVKYQLNKKLQQSIELITKKYEQQQKSLRQQSQSTCNLYNKSLQDINKYKKTYSIILQQLKQNRLKVEEQYHLKVQQAKKYKQKLVNEWKRQSNQQIKKIMNNTHAKNQLLTIDNNRV